MREFQISPIQSTEIDFYARKAAFKSLFIFKRPLTLVQVVRAYHKIKH